MQDDITAKKKTHDTILSAAQAGHASIPENRFPLVCKPREIEPWRIFKIMSEFVEGFEMLKKYTLAATFFGTNRYSFESRFYEDATDLAGRLAKLGFAVITGGSKGVMESANKGAFEAGGASVGLNIHLQSEQSFNSYLTDSLMFDHFFSRKTMLAFASEVYIYFPGGFGTLDEFFEIVTLIQTKKIKRVPIVCYGREYWGELDAFIRKKLLEEHKAIDADDMDIYHIVDSVDEAYDYIVANTTC